MNTLSTVVCKQTAEKEEEEKKQAEKQGGA
jgi:hypothetical protein